MRFGNDIAIVTLSLFATLAPGVYSQDSTRGEKGEKKAVSTQVSAPDESELESLRKQSQVFVSAFNKHDAKAVAECWTITGEFIDDSGQRWAGREEIEKAYAEVFANGPKAEIQIAIESLRLLSKDTAIEEGRSVVVPGPKGTGVSKYSAIHIKVGEQWLMASVRDQWIEAPPAVRSAADLEWMIGSWIAEEHGIKMECICSWAVNDRFLERKYTTTQVDGSVTTGVQLIGWNPQGKSVQSWDFSADGGHSVGVWTPTEGGWQAEVQGMTGAGVPTSAVNIMRRLDGNASVWQSVRRTLGQASLPDTDEIVIRRRQQDAAK